MAEAIYGVIVMAEVSRDRVCTSQGDTGPEGISSIVTIVLEEFLTNQICISQGQIVTAAKRTAQETTAIKEARVLFSLES